MSSERGVERITCMDCVCKRKRVTSESQWHHCVCFESLPVSSGSSSCTVISTKLHKNPQMCTLPQAPRWLIDSPIKSNIKTSHIYVCDLLPLLKKMVLLTEPAVTLETALTTKHCMWLISCFSAVSNKKKKKLSIITGLFFSNWMTLWGGTQTPQQNTLFSVKRVNLWRFYCH